MKRIEEQLIEYRRQKAAERERDQDAGISLTADESNETKSSKRAWLLVIVECLLDGLYRAWEGALDVYPLRAWRAYAARAPLQCTIVTLLTWLVLQIFAAYVEFGVVFFIFSLFIAMVLNLGERKANEPSAYSVFNPHCERLPGQLTAEHFERDILMRNKPIS